MTHSSGNMTHTMTTDMTPTIRRKNHTRIGEWRSSTRQSRPCTARRSAFSSVSQLVAWWKAMPLHESEPEPSLKRVSVMPDVSCSFESSTMSVRSSGTQQSRERRMTTRRLVVRK